MKPAVNERLGRVIEQCFASFLDSHGFRRTADFEHSSDRVVFYDGSDYRLVFEIDPTNDITVVVRSLFDRLRGGALRFLVQFLSEHKKEEVASLAMLAKQLDVYHAEIADLVTGRDEKRYQQFLDWVETNWTQLTTRTGE